MNLADTDVLTDILRGHPPALAWLAALPTRPLISGFAALELAFGCRNAAELARVREFLARFAVIWPADVEVARALEYAPIKLSDGIGLLDSLTAALAVSRGLTLLTYNDRHFRAIPGLITAQPYTR
jgi:hypothetical protein